jgi:nicotinamide-nucleotide amidase
MKLAHFGESNISTITQKIKKIGQILVNHQLTLVTAESCTGGGLAYYLTSIPGSSKWFERSFVTYNNLAKTELLQVSQKLIKEQGAVSESVAKKMVIGALKNSHADISIAITGIAGPDGGTLKKPVGTVWFALAFKNTTTQTLTFHQHFSGSRNAVREKSIVFIIHKIYEKLKAKTFP